MKNILFIILFGAIASPDFSQCTFESKIKPRNDQYTKSSKSDIKSSEAAMAKQNADFQKPKYASTVKPSKEMKKLQKEQAKKEQAEL